eukprot:CAMPEP_0114539238 /NCGR_PEP_ID=MMETSP0114-20121206/133_1 /TAXON_ID=31324 /ORGANISM="Goniomonas sp, Strain m" /LENGTH=74 /DNA_ID=CAMNT_0001723331 /DNA_START=374 /DNA_END=598 /DNA_ORIENTATION=+
MAQRRKQNGDRDMKEAAGKQPEDREMVSKEKVSPSPNSGDSSWPERRKHSRVLAQAGSHHSTIAEASSSFDYCY